MKNELLKKFNFTRSKRAAEHAGAGLGTIRNAYGRYSDEKARAWDQCAAICDDLDGYGLTVCGKNTLPTVARFFQAFACSGVRDRVAGKRRNWLPPQYGKKAYRNMTEEEQQVVLSFDGDEETYNNVYEHQNEYLIGRDEIMKICG